MSEKSRPYMICYMAPSIDGRIVFYRFSKSFYNLNSENQIFEEYNKYGNEELNAEGILVGRNTYYQDICQKQFDVDSHKVPATNFEPFKGPRSSNNYLVVADSRGRSIYEDKIIASNDIIAILGESVSEDYLKYLRDKNISYVFAGKDGRDIAKALHTLKTVFGIERLLLEGGGTLNGTFLKQGLIDEVALLIIPSIDGLCGQPSIFDYQGEVDEFPASGQSLELIDVKSVNYGIVFIRYKVHKVIF
ncbi:hypothetical protein M9Y10_012972 [Tritrichomonas musculus]|uniref:Bacterial bifunctional deaminase-reductase C-terminal domain-containing protein n=1 Tax=Tritrichomonas musculus TaxID=1915356 RepID=A0ABR2I5X9_9EUKA